MCLLFALLTRCFLSFSYRPAHLLSCAAAAAASPFSSRSFFQCTCFEFVPDVPFSVPLPLFFPSLSVSLPLDFLILLLSSLSPFLSTLLLNKCLCLLCLLCLL